MEDSLFKLCLNRIKTPYFSQVFRNFINRIVSKNKIMHYIDKFSKYALALAIIAIIIMIFMWPKKPISSDEYKERSAKLEQEKQELLRKRDSIQISLESSRAEIEVLKNRDSLLQASFNRNKQLITEIKKQYEKRINDINKFGSDDLIRSFAELEER